MANIPHPQGLPPTGRTQERQVGAGGQARAVGQADNSPAGSTSRVTRHSLGPREALHHTGILQHPPPSRRAALPPEQAAPRSVRNSRGCQLGPRDSQRRCPPRAGIPSRTWHHTLCLDILGVGSGTAPGWSSPLGACSSSGRLPVEPWPRKKVEGMSGRAPGPPTAQGVRGLGGPLLGLHMACCYRAMPIIPAWSRVHGGPECSSF